MNENTPNTRILYNIRGTNYSKQLLKHHSKECMANMSRNTQNERYNKTWLTKAWKKTWLTKAKYIEHIWAWLNIWHGQINETWFGSLWLSASSAARVPRSQSHSSSIFQFNDPARIDWLTLVTIKVEQRGRRRGCLSGPDCWGENEWAWSRICRVGEVLLRVLQCQAWDWLNHRHTGFY